MKIAVGLRAEIMVHIVLLLGGALLFGGLLLLKVMERELLDERLRTVTALLDVFSGPEFLGGSLQSLEEREVRLRLMVGDLPHFLVPQSWVLADEQLALVGAVSQADMAQLRRARALREVVLEVDAPFFGLIFGRSYPAGILASAPLDPHGPSPGLVQARFGLADLQQRMASAARLALIYALLYGTVLTIAALLLIQRNVIRPIHQLMQATRGIAEGTLAPVRIDPGPQEISELGHSFNAMVDALLHSRRLTEEHIDSLRKANEEIAEASSALVRAERSASLGQLAAGMAHELGNPLAALIGYLSFLQSEVRDAAQSDVLERALQEAERIDRLVRDLLDYAAPRRVESERLEPVSLLRQTVSMLDRQGTLQGLDIHDQLPAELPEIKAPRHKLEQVFVNLLLNARDASEQGGRLWISGGQENDEIWLAVRDEGKGMDATTQERIFTPFFTTKAPGEGRGLGLAVCRKIVEDIPGRIQVRSTPGAGSEFTVRLKRSKETQDG